MNSWITLDSFKYKTLARSWSPRNINPGTYRITLLGTQDATYGPGTIMEWSGEVSAYITPPFGYGDPDDLRATINKKSMVAFTDHEGNAHTVFVQSGEQTNLLPDWDAASNKVYFEISLRGQ